MNERDLNTALLEAFPELTAEFEEYTSWQDGMDTGAFLTYEDVFRPQAKVNHNTIYYHFDGIDDMAAAFVGRTLSPETSERFIRMVAGTGAAAPRLARP